MAMKPFMSAVPRPWMRPSRCVALNGSLVQHDAAGGRRRRVVGQRAEEVRLLAGAVVDQVRLQAEARQVVAGDLDHAEVRIAADRRHGDQPVDHLERGARGGGGGLGDGGHGGTPDGRGEGGHCRKVASDLRFTIGAEGETDR
jgi:hypothetical protein